MPGEKYMTLALQIAQKGRGYVNPNPMVGAVLVKGGRIIGKGYHRIFGGPHAEVEALREAKAMAKGATMYVTMEPCSHFGKTPPCTRDIIKAGIKKVVVSTVDPNPLNNGRGLEELRKNRIDIEKGVLEKEAKKLNEKFFTYYKKKRPFISVKSAMTLDGKIATVKGNSRWITSGDARRYVHLLRHEHDAIMVGSNTIKKDNPRLTARFNRYMRKPYIVLVDTNLSISMRANVIKNAGKNKVIIATTKYSSAKKRYSLLSRGIKVLVIQSKNRKVNLYALIETLAKEGITSVLVEGGGEIIYSLFRAKLVDKVYFFYAPKILGGRSAPTCVEGEGIKDISKAIEIGDINYSWIGKDLLLMGYPKYNG